MKTVALIIAVVALIVAVGRVVKLSNIATVLMIGCTSWRNSNKVYDPPNSPSIKTTGRIYCIMSLDTST